MVLPGFRDEIEKSHPLRVKLEKSIYNRLQYSSSIHLSGSHHARLSAGHGDAMVGKIELVPAEGNVITCQHNSNQEMDGKGMYSWG